MKKVKAGANIEKEETKDQSNVKPIDAAAKKHLEEQQKIEEAQKVLQEQIDKFNYKKQLIENRENFHLSKEKLLRVTEQMGSDFDDCLDHHQIKIQLIAGPYREDKVISISNNMIIRDFIDFASNKIDSKIAEIEKEILG